ncbi:hypothetical protein GCM10008101_18690 [Lysobacter xinjiangensis]|uniref:Uncharacterized protein n=1 Tax=Cognatilysobacter xinjiangensis TaxID=546892 RepID=A0ABQ3C212_9GAMM|nr:hypothetical protein [Lysobacter xinjiangensis]GGZ65180.1 hypothetical protein GCM10008101_18690 [Lysobacter xinjiangensis]
MLVECWKRLAAALPQRVQGTVGPEGVCAWRRAGERRWTARLRLSPWSTVGHAPTEVPLDIEWEASPAALRRLQRRWRPGATVRLWVRIRAGRLEARLLRP